MNLNFFICKVAKSHVCLKMSWDKVTVASTFIICLWLSVCNDPTRRRSSLQLLWFFRIRTPKAENSLLTYAHPTFSPFPELSSSDVFTVKHEINGGDLRRSKIKARPHLFLLLCTSKITSSLWVERWKSTFSLNFFFFCNYSNTPGGILMSCLQK